MRMRGLAGAGTATGVEKFGAGPPRTAWSWRIGVLVLVGILGLPTIGLLGTVHVVRQAAETRARQDNTVVAGAVAAELGQSFQQRVRVIEGAPGRPALAAALAAHNRAMLQAGGTAALNDGQYCRFTVRAPGLAPVTVSGPGPCWSPGAPPSGAPGLRVVGPGQVGSQAFMGLDLAVAGRPGTSLQAVFPVASLTEFGIPGAGQHTTVVAGTTIVSSSTPALVGHTVASAGSRAMIRAGRSASGTFYAPLLHAVVILAYQPVSGTRLGVFFAVTTKVAYAPAAHLARVLELGYLVLLGIVLALAGLILGMLRRRDRAAGAAAQQYRALAEAMPDGVAIVDDDARLVYANPALVAILGLGSTDTWLGRQIAEWNGLSGDGGLGSSTPVLDSPDTIRRLLANLRHRDGRHIPAEVSSGSFDLGGQRGVICVIRDLTESRAAEAAVVVAEARQRTTIDTVAEGIVVFDLLDGRPVPVLMNPAAVQIWGGSLDDVREMWTNSSAPDLLGTDGTRIELADLTVARTARTGQPTHAEYGLRRDLNEPLRWLRTTANPIRDGEGTMIGIVSSFVDVTSERAERARVEADRARYEALAVEARSSERALRDSEERFRSAFEHAPIAKALIGLDGHYQQVNQAMCELTGYSEDQLCHLTVADIIHPDDLVADVAASAELLKHRAAPSYTIERRYVTATGGIVWGSKTSSLIRDGDGTPRYFIAQIQDVTERRRQEEALADERRRLREAQTLGHIGSWEMDITTGAVSWSDTFLELHGLDPHRFAGGPGAVDQLIHPDDTDRMVSGFYACIETGEAMRARYRVIRHDDQRLRWFDASVVRRQDGDHLRLSGTTVDVTDLVVAAEQVAAARDEALEASKQKSAFLATMSHEIRTPMNAVIGMTGLLLDTALDDEQRDFVETVRRSGDNLLSIINDILDFSKIEAGGLILEHRRFDLRTCVEDALDLVAATANATGLELVGRIDRQCPALVVGDVTRFRQVLVNLLGNATKFTAEGDVLLSVRTEGEPADGGVTLCVAVVDTGIGIPADRLDSLFKSFSQVDASTTRVFGGTGLGLAISQRLIEAMGGVLSVESTPGIGSTFTFKVTLATPTPEEVRSAALPDLTAGALDGRTVLVVDDNAANRESLRLQLEGWGMTVTDVAGGADALGALDAGHHFDVAVVDMQMPGMDGHELAVALRSASAPQSPPIVLLSSPGGRLAMPQPEMFAAILNKPVRAARLEESLVRALHPLEGAPLAVAAPAASAPSSRPPLRVLLAEDNTVNQRLGRLMLEKLGDHVDVVGNGREAVEAVALVPYDVVLMDVEMPVMDGLEATRVIRRDLPAGRQVRIIAMTASALVEDRQACYDAGMDDYLAKPVRLADLDGALALAAAQVPGPPAPPSAAHGRPAVDAAVIDSLVGDLGDGGSSILSDVIAAYLLESESQVSALRDAAARHDLRLAGTVAHKMQSSTALLGAGALADLLRDAAATARNDGVGLDDLTRLVEAEHHRVVAAMASTLARLGP